MASREFVGDFRGILVWQWRILWKPQMAVSSPSIAGDLAVREGGTATASASSQSALLVRLVALWYILWSNLLPLVVVLRWVLPRVAEPGVGALWLAFGGAVFCVAAWFGLVVQGLLLRPFMLCAHWLVYRRRLDTASFPSRRGEVIQWVKRYGAGGRYVILGALAPSYAGLASFLVAARAADPHGVPVRMLRELMLNASVMGYVGVIVALALLLTSPVLRGDKLLWTATAVALCYQAAFVLVILAALSYAPYGGKW